MRRFTKLALPFLAVALVLAASVEAEACTCIGPRPPCEAYWNAHAVFAGVVTDVSRIEVEDVEKNPTPFLRVQVRFAVEEAFRGLDGASEVQVFTGGGGGDCGYRFSKGERYLVYAHRSQAVDNRLVTSICSRTQPIAKAGEDLSYIRGLASAPAGGVVYGNVLRVAHDVREGKRENVPLPGVKIVVEGEGGRYEAETDEAGAYKVAGLRAGKYRVRAVGLPDYLVIDDKPAEINLSERGCALASFWTAIDGRVAGRILDPEGQPVANLAVHLVTVELAGSLKESSGYEQGLMEKRVTGYTNDEGYYEIRRVPPGRYAMLIGMDGTPDLAQANPYPRTFYPGVEDAAQAAIIQIKEGQKLQGHDMRLVRRFVMREIQGVALCAGGGATRQEAHAYLKDAERTWRQMSPPVKLDEQGRFNIKAYEGLKYVIEIYTLVGANRTRVMHSVPLLIPPEGRSGPYELSIKLPAGMCAASR